MIEKRVLRPGATATVELDSQKVEVRLADVTTDGIWLGKEQGKWRQVSAPSASVKNARRNGTFKEAFRNKMALVYGTAGTPAGEPLGVRARTV